MKLAIIANPDKYSVKQPFIDALKWADAYGCKAYFGKKLQQLYNGNDHSSSVMTHSEEEAIEKADIIIAMGGDGTMLYTARLLKHIKKPILGVNSGRLGFMANTQKEQLGEALDNIRQNNFKIAKRYMLEARDQQQNTYHALNEFLFSKRDSTSMITVHAEYDGMFINKYWADGL